MAATKFVATPTLKIDGKAASSELMEDILQIVVEESLHLPGMFTLVIQNDYYAGEENYQVWKHEKLFEIGKSIEIGFAASTTESDEFDEENEIAYNKLDSNTYIFEGKTSLNDFCKIIEEDISLFEQVKGESESLGGLLLEINSKLPNSGDKIKFDRFVFTVVAVDQRRIKRVRVFVSPQTKELHSNFTD